MKLLIKKAKIISPASPFHNKQADIFIDKGIISQIGLNIDAKADLVIIEEGLHASTGWVDIFSHFGEPGLEHKETIETGIKAAAAGGFTDVAVIPNTRPVTDNKSQVNFIKNKAAGLPVNVHPIGAVTKNAEGKELAEMYDMHQNGAVAFSDGTNSLQSTGIMLKALQYVLPVNCSIIQIPEDKNIGSNGLMNEGIVSTRLGLPGKASIAEELMIKMNLELAAYTGSKIHFTGITTAESVNLIRDAKQKGIRVTCSVTPYHLFFCDEDLATYDTNLKVNPPLRTRKDRDALLVAVRNGDVDCIASHHMPQEWDSKVCEFEYAKNGMIGLESLYGVIGIAGISTGQFVKMQTINAAHILNLPVKELKEGAAACITLFNPETTYTFSETMIHSKSKNSAFISKDLKGKIIGIINGDKHYIN